MILNLQHPDITAAERTGYPMWAQPEQRLVERPKCVECGAQAGDGQTKKLYKMLDAEEQEQTFCKLHALEEMIRILRDCLPFEDALELFGGYELNEEDCND